MLAAGEDDLSRTDVWLLDRIRVAGPFRLSQLAAWQAVDKSTMTAQIRRLERRGLIERSPDPADGRATLVSVTAAGLAVNERNRAVARAVFDRVVADWSPADQTAFSTLLDRFARALEERPPSPAIGLPGADERRIDA
jgi:DNA-binding MarR family transcriptional regulator